MSDFEPGPGENVPGTDITWQQRSDAVDLVVKAMERGEFEFDELEARLAAVNAARSEAELARLGGLPVQNAPAPPVSYAPRQPIRARAFGVIGDLRIGGSVQIDEPVSYTNLVGDTVVDLSAALIPMTGATVTARTAIGDIKVILPEGVRFSLSGGPVVGETRQDVVSPVPGAPTIDLRLQVAVGDVEIYSLSRVPTGKLRKLWNQFRSQL